MSLSGVSRETSGFRQHLQLIRSELSNRPLLLAFLCLMIGISLSASLWNVLLALPILWLIRSNRTRALLAVVVVVGALVAPKPADLAPVPEYFEGTVVTLSQPFYARFVNYTEVRTQDGKRVTLRTSRRDTYPIGTTLSLRAVRSERESEVPYRSKYVLSPVRGSVEVVGAGSPFGALGIAMRNDYLRHAEQHLSPTAKAVSAALVVGDESELSKYQDLFRISGTTHLIAVSGLQVGLLCVFLLTALWIVPAPRSLKLGLVFAILILYAFITGLQAPIVRATIMAILFLSAYLFFRSPDLLTALAAGGIVYLLWVPYGLWNVGFQLSFLCIAALSLLFPRFDPVLPTRDGSFSKDALFLGASAAVATTICTVVALPVIALYFGVFGVYAVPANLISAPLVPLLMLSSLAAWALSPIAPPVAALFWTYAVEPISLTFTHAASLFGTVPGAEAHVPGLPIWAMIAFYAVLMLFWRPKQLPQVSQTAEDGL
jgi:ComEC/Rec2-related protein